jgi:hypothetical protein
MGQRGDSFERPNSKVGEARVRRTVRDVAATGARLRRSAGAWLATVVAALCMAGELGGETASAEARPAGPPTGPSSSSSLANWTS